MAVQETGKKFTVQEIESTLTEGVAAILAADKASLGGDQPFGLVEILVFIEKTFKLQLIHSDLTRQDFETIRSLASFIHKNL